MAINLFPHNQTAYEAAVKMLKERRKAAVVHPTGTGKSFIGFKLCEDNPDKIICWLSPSRYIYQTQIENLREVSDGYEPGNVNFYTYAKLMMLTEEKLADITPDFIILDEFHRCGAEYWGAGVQKLLELYPNTPLLGLSATAIRYLDNQRNMTDELFDGNIASEMTLGEAIVRGILNPPKYIMSIFSYQKDLEKYEKRIHSSKNQKMRDAATEYLESLRRALDKADKLDILFDKHMQDRSGKYIVFCANRDHMQDMADKADEWFYRIDKEPHIYKVYSDDPTASKSFTAFKEDNDENHLKLLYCIDALNEGVHVSDISGVILLRPTTSPIIFKQQIGRALSASKESSTVIFDIVNNIENLYSIDSVKEEMEIAVRYFHEFNRDNEIVNDTFEVSDDIRDCIKLFDALEETLTVSWETMFAEAKRYYEENGNLIVPQKYISSNGYQLGVWVCAQRTNYHKKQYLSESRIKRLESIGMCWLTADERLWNETYEICKAYYDKNHTLDNIGRYSQKARIWLVNQRAKYNNNQLSDEEIKKLESIGMIWNLDEVWERNYEYARRFYEEKGHLDIPAKYITDDGFSLGHWYRTVRKAYLNRTLDEDKRKKLEAIGMEEESILTRTWMQKYRLAKQYFDQNGNLNISSSFVCDDGTKLGIWISTQRERYNKKQLDKEQIELLEKIGMTWNRDDSRWNIGFNHAAEYIRAGNNINAVPDNYLIGEYNLSTWIRAQRDRYRKGKISEERIKKLESIGFIWDLQENMWNNNYLHARNYYIEHGNLSVPKTYVCEDGLKLGDWITNVRTRYKKGKLTPEQISQLESIGMIWNPAEIRKETELLHAKEYFEKYGNLDIPKDYESDDGYRLGAWLRIVRTRYKKGNLDSEYIKQLESMGIIWNPVEKAWQTGVYHLKTYNLQNDNGNVPYSFICEDGFMLGEWLRGQLRKYKAGTLSEERINILKENGVSL